MIYRLFLISSLTFLIVNNVCSQEVVKEKATEKANKPGGSSVNKEVKSEELFEEPNIKEEKEVIEESPVRGEPVIGAEIFEEQTPAQPVENKRPEKKRNVEKEKKTDGILEE